MSSSRPSAVVSSSRAARRSATVMSMRPLPDARPLKRRLECRRFRRDADHVKQRDPTGRSRRGGERLQLIFGRRDHDAVDHRDVIARRACRPDGRARRRTDRPAAAPAGTPTSRSSSLPAAILGQMQADRRHAAGDRAADVEQIRIALGARADHGVGERDRVRLAPRDLLAERPAACASGTARRSTSAPRPSVRRRASAAPPSRPTPATPPSPSSRTRPRRSRSGWSAPRRARRATPAARRTPASRRRGKWCCRCAPARCPSARRRRTRPPSARGSTSPAAAPGPWSPSSIARSRSDQIAARDLTIIRRMRTRTDLSLVAAHARPRRSLRPRGSGTPRGDDAVTHPEAGARLRRRRDARGLGGARERRAHRRGRAGRERRRRRREGDRPAGHDADAGARRRALAHPAARLQRSVVDRSGVARRARAARRARDQSSARHAAWPASRPSAISAPKARGTPTSS